MTDRTNGPFRVGDVCVFVDGITHETTGENMGGLEATIIGELQPRFWITRDELVRSFRVEVDGGRIVVAEPHELRLKRIPDEPRADFTPSTWDVGPFNPYRQKERV